MIEEIDEGGHITIALPLSSEGVLVLRSHLEALPIRRYAYNAIRHYFNTVRERGGIDATMYRLSSWCEWIYDAYKVASPIAPEFAGTGDVELDIWINDDIMIEPQYVREDGTPRNGFFGDFMIARTSIDTFWVCCDSQAECIASPRWWAYAVNTDDDPNLTPSEFFERFGC